MAHDLNAEWMHIDEWLDEPPIDDGERVAKEWLSKFRAPVMDRDRTWLERRALYCVYQGDLFRVTGASRLGDVWLARSLGRTHGYDMRVDVAECSGWRMEADNGAND